MCILTILPTDRSKSPNWTRSPWHAHLAHSAVTQDKGSLNRDTSGLEQYTQRLRTHGITALSAARCQEHADEPDFLVRPIAPLELPTLTRPLDPRRGYLAFTACVTLRRVITFVATRSLDRRGRHGPSRATIPRQRHAHVHMCPRCQHLPPAPSAGPATLCAPAQ